MLFYVIFVTSFCLNYLLFSNILPEIITKWISNVIFTLILTYFSWQVTQLIWRMKFVPKKVVNPTGKCVLITGCDTGFGHLLAQRLAEYGFKVYAGCLLPDGDGAKKLSQKYPKNIEILPLDVTKDDQVQQARKILDNSIGNKKLWAIVNNAGIFASTEIEFGDMSSFISQMNVNCLGIVRVTKAFLPLLRKFDNGQTGRVVNVASLAGRLCIPGIVGYCMSKAAVISFSDGLRREMKKWGIEVICIEPHLHKTNLVNDQVHQSGLLKAWEQTPDDVREDYGDCYLHGYQALLEKALHTAREQVDKVVDTMTIAVTHESVSCYYRVMGDIERIRVWMFEYLWPVKVLDYISYLGCVWITGLPAKLRQNYDKKVN